MTPYEQWAARHPQAAADLNAVIGAIAWPASEQAAGRSEAWAQQQARFDIARQGGLSWRNNVGATPAKTPVTCPGCGFKHELKQTPTRYGLANESKKLNEKVKSSDLILAIPRQITPEMVGTTIAQFGSVECKRPGWTYRGDERERGQAAWLELVASIGGFATFSTGEVKL